HSISSVHSLQVHVVGSNTTLDYLEPPGVVHVLVREVTLTSHDFESLEAAIELFLDAGPRPEIEAACIGIAGPVVDGRGTTTNLPWVVEERRLACAIPAGRVRLLNDLGATARGIWALGEDA